MEEALSPARRACNSCPRKHSGLSGQECELDPAARGGPSTDRRRLRAPESPGLRGVARRPVFCADLRTAARIVSSTFRVPATSTEGHRVVKVFLVDDHEVVRRGLVDLLGEDPELEVVGEAGSVSQALARIPALQ